ncbi:hypothetical protein ACLB2K_072673 [Fragaria x ananassa]
MDLAEKKLRQVQEKQKRRRNKKRERKQLEKRLKREREAAEKRASEAFKVRQLLADELEERLKEKKKGKHVGKKSKKGGYGRNPEAARYNTRNKGKKHFEPGKEEDTDDSELKFDENVNGDPDAVPKFEEMGYEGHCSNEVCNSDRLESLAGSETEEDEEGNPIKMPTRRVAKEVKEILLVDEDWSRKGIHKHIEDTYKIDIPMQTITRGKRAARKIIEGHYIEQYNKLAAYRKELLRSNPRSTVEIMTEMNGPVRSFKRMYICFQACKEGWMKGCKPLIGLDGCHIKGHHSGQLLTAISIVANNEIFPIGYAMVERESA